MEAVATAKYLHCSARKVRQVADMVRNGTVESALQTLFPLKKHKKSARMLDKVLQSAVANLREKKSNEYIEADQLKITTIKVDIGPQMKRIRPRAQGRAYRIVKKLCHLTVSVSE